MHLKILWLDRVVQPDHAVVHPRSEELGGDGHNSPVGVEGHLKCKCINKIRNEKIVVFEYGFNIQYSG